jgi:hypothetical protein
LNLENLCCDSVAQGYARALSQVRTWIKERRYQDIDCAYSGIPSTPERSAKAGLPCRKTLSRILFADLSALDLQNAMLLDLVGQNPLVAIVDDVSTQGRAQSLQHDCDKSESIL